MARVVKDGAECTQCQRVMNDFGFYIAACYLTLFASLAFALWRIRGAPVN